MDLEAGPLRCNWLGGEDGLCLFSKERARALQGLYPERVQAVIQGEGAHLICLSGCTCLSFGLLSYYDSISSGSYGISSFQTVN